MADAIHKQCLDATVSTISGLSLSGINSSSIVARKTAFEGTFVQHGIVVSWDDPRDTPTDSRPTNVRDMIGYPCVVTIIEGSGRGGTDQLNTIADRRQKIRRAFHNIRISITGDTDVNLVICKVVQGAPTIPKEYLDNRDVSQLVVWYWVLEPRA